MAASAGRIDPGTELVGMGGASRVTRLDTVQFSVYCFGVCVILSNGTESATVRLDIPALRLDNVGRQRGGCAHGDRRE